LKLSVEVVRSRVDPCYWNALTQQPEVNYFDVLEKSDFP